MNTRGVRVGIVQGGRLVEERLLVDPRRVTVGPGARSTFVVPPGPIRRDVRLLERRRGRYHLRVPPGMEARVSPAAEPDARHGGLVPLPDTARGRVACGDLTVLFQLVPPPPPRPRPQLPASVRGGRLARMDRLFAAIAALSLLAHVAMVVYLRRVDWPRQPEVAEAPIVRWPRSWRPLPKPVATSVPVPAPAQPSAGPATTPRPHSGGERGPRPDHAREVRLAIQNALGDVQHVLDEIGVGLPDTDQEQAFQNVSGVTYAGQPGLATVLPGGGPGGKIAAPRGFGDTGIIAVANVVGRRHTENIVHVPPTEIGHDGDEKALPPDQLARLIRSRIADVRLCYERALKQRPDISGKLLLRFTLTAAGTVTHVAIDEDTMHDPEVAACVAAAVSRWRFPPPPSGAVEVSFPFVFQAAR